jgi:IS5 family transposase
LNLITGSGCDGALGFFDLSRRYEGLDVKDDPLVAIAAMVPWESL